MPVQTKVNTAVEEIKHRTKNTSDLVSSRESESILVEYMDELARSEFNYSFTLNVIS